MASQRDTAADGEAQDAPEATGPDGQPVVTAAQAQAQDLAAPAPDAAPAAPSDVPPGRVLGPGETPSSGRVTLAPVPPLGSLTLPPLEEGGQQIVIEAEGTEVSQKAAQRAYEAALRAGVRLQEL